MNHIRSSCVIRPDLNLHLAASSFANSNSTLFRSCPMNSLLFPTPQPSSDQLVIVRDHKNVKYERTFADVGCRPYLFHHTSIKIVTTGFISFSPSHLCIKRTLCATRRLLGAFDSLRLPVHVSKHLSLPIIK